MKQAVGTLAFIARFVVLGLAVAFVISLLWPGVGDRLRAGVGLHSAQAPGSGTSAPTIRGRSSGPVSYADAVARAAPSVVNIYANKMVTEQGVQMYSDPVLQRLFGGRPAIYKIGRAHV